MGRSESPDCHVIYQVMSCDLRLEEQGRVEAAMESYREALELDPGEETAEGETGSSCGCH